MATHLSTRERLAWRQSVDTPAPWIRDGSDGVGGVTTARIYLYIHTIANRIYYFIHMGIAIGLCPYVVKKRTRCMSDGNHREWAVDAVNGIIIANFKFFFLSFRSWTSKLYNLNNFNKSNSYETRYTIKSKKKKIIRS